MGDVTTTARGFTTIEVDDGGGGPIGRLELNRPDKLNPLGTETLLELERAARWFDERDGVKVVIVSGRGRSFSAGADIASFGGSEANAGHPPRDAADAGRRMAEAVEAMRAVTVAAIKGHCVGGGLVLAAACDLRVAADDTYFSIPEVDLGIPLAWGGIPRLVREIGPAMTRELVMTCRPFDAAEARSLGFLNRVVPASEMMGEAEALAASLAPKATLALTATKRHVNAVLESMCGTARNWSDADGLVTALRDPESREAAAAYLRRVRGG
ncbi:MAG: enoyl-CoA hydratase/isomerase family protein [Actinomycetota bacterium]|nr:enoyl-CoA hydratase/isomerase family protein [Actinomycetota bacterium]